MNCPYCGCEMKKGSLYTPTNGVPYWKEDGSKRDILSEKGKLPITSTLFVNKIESFYCGFCKKLVIDADLHL